MRLSAPWMNMLALMVALAAGPMEAVAQKTPDGTPDNSGREGSIVVTAERAISATKVDTPIVKTPQSISVVTRARLDRQVITDSLTDILSYVPGVVASPFGFDSRVDRFSIRGFDAAAFGLYRDSLQLPSFGDPDRSFRIEPYGVEQLEILRGPSSVLYGNGSPGGLVNAISKRPTQKPLAEVELEGGSFNRYAGKFDVGGPLKDGQLAYRVTGLARDADTQVDFAKNNRIYIAPALTWTPDANTSVTVLSNYLRSVTAGFIQNLPAVGTLYDSPYGRLPRSRSTAEPDFDHQRNYEYSIGYELSHRFSPNLRFQQNARYDYVNVDARTITASGYDPDDPAQRYVLRSSFTGRERGKSVAVDNQLHATFGTGRVSHVFLVGVEYKHYDLKDAQAGGDDDVAPLDIFDPTYGATVTPPPLFFDGRTRQGQVGLYAEERMTFADHLVVSFGGREDFVSKHQTDQVAQTDQRTNDQKFDGNAGILYLSDIGLAPYFSYSESFLPLFGTDIHGNPFAPETGHQYEVGLKYQPKGSASFISADLFNLKQQNALTPDPTNPDFSVQVGEQQSRGAEVEAKLSLLETHLNIDASYTYEDVKTLRSNAGDIGKHPATVPANIASIYVDYLIPTGPLAGFGLGGGARYQSSTFGDQFNTFKVPGFTVYDAAIRYDWGRLRFALSAKNIFDKKYVAECTDMTSCNYGQARAVVGIAGYRF